MAGIISHRVPRRYEIWVRFIRGFAGSLLRGGLWSLPPHIWLSLGIRGFLPNKYRRYRLDRNDWKLYLSDRHNYLSSTIDGRYGIVLEDKVLFEQVMGPHVKVPRNYALISGGKILWLDPDLGADNLLGLLRDRERLILKPADKSGGKGVRLFEYREGAYRCNALETDEQDVIGKMMQSGNSIVMEYIHQGDYASGLYPATVNTIRVLTMRDVNNRVPFIAAALQRVGCARSFPVDNVSAGGLFCHIDLATGRLGKGIEGLFSRDSLRWIERHPETGIVFEDQAIPDWPRVCDKMLDLAERFPLLPYVAWDVAILDGDVAVIEGNSWSEISAFQIGKPLLADHRVNEFLRRYNVL